MRVGLMIAGIVSGAIGLDIWVNQGGSLYRQPVPQYAGIALIFFGLFSLGIGLFNSRKKSVTYICPECENVIEHSEDAEIQCDKCGIKMEPLKGFYKRHPEKKIEK